MGSTQRYRFRAVDMYQELEWATRIGSIKIILHDEEPEDRVDIVINDNWWNNVPLQNSHKLINRLFKTYDELSEELTILKEALYLNIECNDDIIASLEEFFRLTRRIRLIKEYLSDIENGDYYWEDNTLGDYWEDNTL